MFRSIFRHAAREVSLTRVFDAIARARARPRGRIIRRLAAQEIAPVDAVSDLLASIQRRAWFLRHLLHDELALARDCTEVAGWSLEHFLALRSLRRTRHTIERWVDEDREDIRLALLEADHDNDMLEAVDLTITGTVTYLADIAAAPRY